MPSSRNQLGKICRLKIVEKPNRIRYRQQMSISPITPTSALVERFTAIQPAAGVTVLGHKTGPSSGPEALMGSGMPTGSLVGKIYGPDGRLQQLEGAGSRYLMRV